MAAKSQASPNNKARDTNLTGAMVMDINTIWNFKIKKDLRFKKEKRLEQLKKYISCTLI